MIAHPLKVRELIDEIARGEVLLPEFQRAYVWKPAQVVRLLDSLYRGYPTGQILLWDTQSLPLTKGLEGVEQTGLLPPGRPKVVLDGQQRLTSLYRALAPEVQDPVDVRFHLETERFQLHRRRMDGDPYWVSLRDVLNQARHDLDILRQIVAKGGPGLDDPRTAVYLDRLQALRRVNDYRFPIEVFRSDDYEQVTELFVRINSGGTRLRQAELVLAQLALRLPGVLTAGVERAVAEMEEEGFALDPRFFVRALVAVGTGRSRFGGLTALLQRDAAQLEALWDQTWSATRRAVGFVRQRARFASSDWVSSLNALVPLVALFARRERLARGEEVALLRWFYLALLRGRYSGATETALDEDLRAVRGERPVLDLLEGTLSRAGTRVGIEPEEFDDADWRNPLFPIAFAAACQRGARDWWTGQPLAEAPALARGRVVVHPVFPRGLLRTARVEARQREQLANLVFLASEPPPELVAAPPARVLAQVAASDPARLTAQGIPLEPALWEVERYPEFLARRRELLAAAVNALLDDPA